MSYRMLRQIVLINQENSGTNWYLEVEILMSHRTSISEDNRKIGITEQTYYRWFREYGGMRVEQAKRLKERER